MQATQIDSHFNAIRLSLSSPEQVREWSYGQVTKPETINYRTLRPERDGLFCERIFGPQKDWECACGKYKKIRFKGIKCERCGVEVTSSKVRRERMGHIELAAPVAHIWFSKGVPSRLGILLDMSPRNLERVLYFAQYIVTSVNQELLEKAPEELEKKYKDKLETIDQWLEEEKTKVLNEQSEIENGKPQSVENEKIEQAIRLLEQTAKEKTVVGEEEHQRQVAELGEIQPMQLLVESRNRELKERHPGLFSSGMGAEAILALLKQLDLDAEREKLVNEMRSTSGQRRKKAVKRLRVVDAFRNSGNIPEWMILSVLPVLPPDLRPMVQLDGGRFATSDLNDLYRRAINRNNRLKRLLELDAPEIIIRNEKRMLQEAVDALIDNGRRGRAISGSHNHKLKSLSDLLRGKQGRFRQNLLGKRVDYSGRSVIVVGPELKIYQCGLPKKMALELFKPFVMHRLVLTGLTPNIRSAKRMVEKIHPDVWDVLEDVIESRPVFLNRAPTLHRLGIQAFMPVLIEGSAIQLHPLVCTAFNADFDGDQMAVHVPLSRGSVEEAKQLMLSTQNMLSPASGEPMVAPTLDIVLGCFYLTREGEYPEEGIRRFGSVDEAILAKEIKLIGLQNPILISDPKLSPEVWVRTTVGRLIFRDVLPVELVGDPNNWNQLMDKSALNALVSRSYREFGNEITAVLLDKIKELGFHFATISGITIGINDLEVSGKKSEVLEIARNQISTLEEQYQSGLISQSERYDQTIRVWTEASDSMTVVIEESLPSFGGVYLMATSGAKGNISQIKQMAGMRGLMSDPKGHLIEVPVISSFREGLSVLEYFISTHGARKGLADTALRTADSGYLTRRMIDVAQDVIALIEDCGTDNGIWVRHEPDKERNNLLAPFPERIKGRLLSLPAVSADTGQSYMDVNAIITPEASVELWEAGVKEVFIRSPLTCEARQGICQNCYGILPATGRLIDRGEAAGIIAAQSIGEPGTQLTMRTFHTGGVAGVDITSGIPRVEELFEARIPKGHSILAELGGTVIVEEGVDNKRIRITSVEEYREEYPIGSRHKVLVKTGESIEVGKILASPKRRRKTTNDSLDEGVSEVVAGVSGRVEIGKENIAVVWNEEEERLYMASPISQLLVKTGSKVDAGDELTVGQKNPFDVLRIRGKEALQGYIVEEVQKVYRMQGVSINDKHIEIIIRQMLRKVRVDFSGDTDLLPGEPVEKFLFAKINKKSLSGGGEPARATPLLLGITRASLSTDSFLAAASFQETTRVLTETAINGMVDRLHGLKENVIIGRLIPAQAARITQERKAFRLEHEKLISDIGRSKGSSWKEGIKDELDGIDAFLTAKVSDVAQLDGVVEGNLNADGKSMSDGSQNENN